MAYASDTKVSVEKTRAELESLLRRAGASQFMSGWDDARAMVAFVHCGRQIRFILPLPDPDSEEFWLTPGRRTKRTADKARKEWEQACRARWRALLLTIKAKLEAIAISISTFEEEFLAWTIVPGTSETLYDRLEDELRQAVLSGVEPRLMLGGGS